MITIERLGMGRLLMSHQRTPVLKDQTAAIAPFFTTILVLYTLMFNQLLEIQKPSPTEFTFLRIISSVCVQMQFQWFLL